MDRLDVRPCDGLGTRLPEIFARGGERYRFDFFFGMKRKRWRWLSQCCSRNPSPIVRIGARGAAGQGLGLHDRKGPFPIFPHGGRQGHLRPHLPNQRGRASRRSNAKYREANRVRSSDLAKGAGGGGKRNPHDSEKARAMYDSIFPFVGMRHERRDKDTQMDHSVNQWTPSVSSRATEVLLVNIRPARGRLLEFCRHSKKEESSCQFRKNYFRHRIRPSSPCGPPHGRRVFLSAVSPMEPRASAHQPSDDKGVYYRVSRTTPSSA